MGLTPGVVFSVSRKAPLGDPIEISVRNFTLTLRKGESAYIPHTAPMLTLHGKGRAALSMPR